MTGHELIYVLEFHTARLFRGVRKNNYIFIVRSTILTDSRRVKGRFDCEEEGVEMTRIEILKCADNSHNIE